MKTITIIMILLVGWISSDHVSEHIFIERLSMDNAAVLLVDHQTGLANGVRDKSQNDFRSALLALAKLANLFDLPTIVTTSRPNGPNGPYIPEVLELLNNATVINRPGEINAMDNQEFFDAVKATGRTKFIVSGIVTEVCVAFVAFSLLQEGYDVYVALDASGTYDERAQNIAIDRMVHAGAQPMTWFAIACELQGDWRDSTGEGFTQIVSENLPWYGYLINSWNYTLMNGGGAPTEEPATEEPATEAPNTESPPPNTEAPNTESPPPNTEAPNTESPPPATEIPPGTSL
jgi:nicotinamidase-related amidase